MAQYAMLATLVLLPLARLCPCPPAPAASEVCGSDHVTYPSQCDMECAAVSEFSLRGMAVWRQPSGLSLKHPGPCSPEEVALGRPVDVNATRPTGRYAQHRSRRSATEEVRKWDECTNSQCGNATCSVCTDDQRRCVDMCHVNCLCVCSGQPRGGMDAELWWECFGGKGRCWHKYRACKASCGGQECEDSCELDQRECACQCAQQADNSTTEAVTNISGATEVVTNTSATTETVTNTSGATEASTENVTNTSGATEAVTNTSATTEAVANTSATPEAVTSIISTSTEALHSSRGRSATADWNWRKYTACVEESRECGRGPYGWLRELRRENSTCACMGLPGGDLGSYRRVGECLEREDCRGREARCEDACRTDDCKDACRLGELRCRCVCNHRGRASLGNNVTADAEETGERIKPAQDAK
ncbi:uncharacterized protein LOC113208551 [Frankliniella occidentalis]|uniref:Uncharacterized protein LOC113208551 n=1 Tax=Frankliniella occidentalis TaxID=133901 RepID=A0A6J1SJF0_FRAOC|nr:uncharacterized protein LOC113208551 [Frankliniella occidentalis]